MKVKNKGIEQRVFVLSKHTNSSFLFHFAQCFVIEVFVVSSRRLKNQTIIQKKSQLRIVRRLMCRREKLLSRLLVFIVTSGWFWLCVWTVVLSSRLCFRLSSGSGSRPVHPHSLSRSITLDPSYVEFTYFVVIPVNGNEFPFFRHDLRDVRWHKSTENPSFCVFPIRDRSELQSKLDSDAPVKPGVLG